MKDSPIMATLPAAVLSTRGAMKQGRSSFSGHRITILGAGGFMGRYVTSRLGAVGCQMVLPYRGDELYMRHLKPMADLGAISFVKYSIRRLEDVEKVVAGSDVVINLIGLKSETKRWSYQDVNVTFPAVLGEVCTDHGVGRLIHLSALGAATDVDCGWLRSKALGEAAVKDAFPLATVLRPATCFGEEDKTFLNSKAKLCRHLPAFPLVDGGGARAQPVFVDDVAKAVVSAVCDPSTAGKTYSLAGPGIYTQAELAQIVFDGIGDESTAISVPKAAAIAAASATAMLPDPWMWPDLVKLEAVDTILANEPTGTGTLADLGVSATSMDPFAPRQMFVYKKKSPFIDDTVHVREPS